MTIDNVMKDFDIRKELKYLRVAYSSKNKVFLVETLDRQVNKVNEFPIVTGRIILNKVYAFSLLRFIIRIAQRNCHRRKK